MDYLEGVGIILVGNSMAQTFDEGQHTTDNAHTGTLFDHSSLSITMLQTQNGELVAKGVDITLLTFTG